MPSLASRLAMASTSASSRGLATDPSTRMDVVHRGAIAAPHDQHILVARGYQNREPRAVALKRSVGGNGRAVHNALQCARLGSELRNAGENAFRLIARGRRRLADGKRAASGVEQHQISERAADVNAESEHLLSRPAKGSSSRASCDGT